MSKKSLSIHIILIIFLGLVVYAGSLNGRFIYDDELLIKNNAFIIDGAGIGRFFTTDIMAGAGMTSPFYRPLQMISYALDYSIWNLKEIGFHATNMLLHVMVALCIYWIINILYDDNKLSFLTATLFVVHPIHTEAVSYISGRADPLSVFFMLLCFIIYIKQADHKKISILSYASLLITYGLALLSKETSIILPLLLLFYHFVFKKKLRMMEFVSLLGVLAVYLVARLTYFKSISALPQIGTDTIFDRIPGFFAAILTYVKLLLLPVPLHMEYGAKLFGFTDPRVITGIIITVIMLAFTYRNRTNRIILFSMGWFFLALFPVCNLYKINAYMAEHFLYLPSVGFFLLLAYFFITIYNNKRYNALGAILIIGALLFYPTLTIKQNDYWKDPVTFLDRTLKFAPDSASAYYGRGILYDKKGNYDHAIEDYNMAIKIKPDYADAYNNRGIVYDKKGDYDRAIADYGMAIQIKPDYAGPRQNLRKTYEKIDKDVVSRNASTP